MNQRTKVAIERQIAAMGAEVFEVGLYKPRSADTQRYEPEMLPRVWDRETLFRSTTWLCYQNAQGRNVYVRPKGEHHLSLVDDLTADAIQRMKTEGFAPAVVVETSPENFQAWVSHGKVLPKQLSTLTARTLAERFGGDKGAADWRHFGRLAGLTNRKERHCGEDGRYPFVRLIEATGTPYEARESFLQQLSSQLVDRQRITKPSASPLVNREARLTIDDFRRKATYGGDGNRIDLAYAIYALSHGVGEADVRAAIASRDLSKKGPEHRQAQYVDRTIRKACSTLGR
jgi:RepB DNA-primase from phage plasmid